MSYPFKEFSNPEAGQPHSAWPLPPPFSCRRRGVPKKQEEQDRDGT